MAKKPNPDDPKFDFKAKWRFEGFREDVIEAGEIVQASESEAAPFLGPMGVLERVVSEPAEPASDDSGSKEPAQ